MAAAPGLEQEKVWRHGIIEAKSDAGIFYMASKRDFAQKLGLKLEFVPLKTDVTGAADGLSLYDLDNGRTSLVAIGVANVRAAGSILWWSTGSGDSVTWSALDRGAG